MMLRRFAAETGSVVKVFNQPGCPFLTLQQTQADQASACTHFVKASLSAMAQEAGPQDTVFLAALRVPRLVDQNGPAQGSVEAALQAAQKDRTAAVAEAAALLSPLAATQAKLVFEAPKPVLPSPTFRCADWFNKMNPVCKEGSSIPRITMPTAYLSPFVNETNDYINRMKEILRGCGYDVAPMSFKTLLSPKVMGMFRRENIVLVHWLETRAFKKGPNGARIDLPGLLQLAIYLAVMAVMRAITAR